MEPWIILNDWFHFWMALTIINGANWFIGSMAPFQDSPPKVYPQIKILDNDSCIVVNTLLFPVRHREAVAANCRRDRVRLCRISRRNRSTARQRKSLIRTFAQFKLPHDVNSIPYLFISSYHQNTCPICFQLRISFSFALRLEKLNILKYLTAKSRNFYVNLFIYCFKLVANNYGSKYNSNKLLHR